MKRGEYPVLPPGPRPRFTAPHPSPQQPPRPSTPPPHRSATMNRTNACPTLHPEGSCLDTIT
ncbi:MAG: hypothetical protein E7001_03805 [Coriobacteriaceae bacterium]|nr:hypothetical protein [Coriobacteriaceae bacterium]